MSVIPDPTNPTGSAIDGESGDILGAVFMAPLGADFRDRDAWTHVGWSKGFGLDKSNEARPDRLA